MEYRVHHGMRRKLQLVGDIIDLRCDRKVAKVLEGQLVVGARGTRRLDVRL